MVADEVGQVGVQVLQELESVVHKEDLRGSSTLSGATRSRRLVFEVQCSPSATQLAG